MKLLKTVLILLIFFILIINFSGCAIGTLQTAQTTPEGHVDLFVGGTELGIFLPEIGFKYGVGRNFDIGIRLFGLGFMGEVKYAPIQARGQKPGPSLAFIGGLGYSKLDDDVSFITAELGAIFSLNLGNIIEPYASVKYHLFGFAETSNVDFSDLAGDFIVTTVGISLFSRKTISIFAEASRLQHVTIFQTDATGKSSFIFSGGLRLRI